MNLNIGNIDALNTLPITHILSKITFSTKSFSTYVFCDYNIVMPKLKRVSVKNEIFCQRLMAGDSQIDAYIKAFEPKEGSRADWSRDASRLMRNKSISAKLTHLKKKITDVAKIDAEWVVRHWVTIVEAEVNDIVQHRRNCCRYCYGVNHKYQWTENELAMSQAYIMKENLERKDDRQLPMPDSSGGVGFFPQRIPAEDCPECFGNGIAEVYTADTTQLNDVAKSLYAGVKDGNVLLHSKTDALKNIANYLGMFKPVINKPGIGELPAPPSELSGRLRDITSDPIEAARLYQIFIMGNKNG